MKTLGEAIGLGIWEGILKTLKGKYFKSRGSNRSYFYFPEINISTPLEIHHENNFYIDSRTAIGDIKLRIIKYEDTVFNPTKIHTLIPLEELFFDYDEITEEEFKENTKSIEDEINKFK